MNDFTKEELLGIARALRVMYKMDYDMPEGCNAYNLYTKVEDLIDTYCEHEPEGHYHVCVDKCKHCGVIINE